MKTLIRIALILLAALVVAGVVWGVSQSSVGEAMRAQTSEGRPDGPPGDFDPESMPEGGDFERGDFDGGGARGLSLATTAGNLATIGGITAAVIALSLVGGAIRKARRPASAGSST